MLSGDGEEGDPATRCPVLLFHPLANISGLYFALYAGVYGRAVQLFERFRVEDWAAAVRHHRPRLLWLPPAAIAMVVDAGVPPEALSGALAMRSGAAPLSGTLRDRFETTYGLPILSHYGASEFGGIVAAMTRGDHARYGAAKRGSVGRARPGVALRVVDPEQGTPCPAGATGLLEVGAPRVGPGWMRTTDLARLDADGFLFLEGRSDDAINRGGFKILPEQVADVLRGHRAVRDVVVVGLPDGRLGEVPVATVVLSEQGAGTGAQELEAFARRHLLAYQVPVRFLFVDDLPRTGTMKVDRRKVLALFDQEAGERSA
jgi:acyl-coenzyme A synthetase/AMP-(fatty) acid ligase